MLEEKKEQPERPTARRRKRRQRRGAKKAKKRKIIALSITGGVLLALLIFHASLERFFLRDFGECTTAQLTDKVAISDGKQNLKYRFQLEGDPQYGSFSSANMIEVVSNEICIVYLPALPFINRPIESFAYEDRNCFCNIP
ncbi:hypothetical protein [Pedobacter sp. SYSU D00535]|uniref:hypothetical protein n=1 Tax=Pedobacter sp. SYSU D00535 TaxID=2810308 RepID=UPI001A958595|nr:hypothetical protein [Pedobacter sp. SYSU D00535]